MGLPNETEDNRFVATGPNEGFTIRGVSGFYTDAALLDYGVNVQGNRCGVYGESDIVAGSPRHSPSGARAGEWVGVCGVGRTYGVLGKGSQIAGVYGQCEETNGAGVIGVAENAVVGVLGASIARGIGAAAKGIGVGVRGDSDSANGFGVVGRSIEAFAASQFPHPSDDGGVPKVNGAGTGVWGSSGSGVGVKGSSKSGPGVQGTSETDRGAVFASSLAAATPAPLVAQVRLVPVTQRGVAPSQLPKHGQVGDLLMLRNTLATGDDQRVDTCTLWLCVPDIAGSDDSSLWCPVQLGGTVLGTL